MPDLGFISMSFCCCPGSKEPHAIQSTKGWIRGYLTIGHFMERKPVHTLWGGNQWNSWLFAFANSLSEQQKGRASCALLLRTSKGSWPRVCHFSAWPLSQRETMERRVSNRLKGVHKLFSRKTETRARPSRDKKKGIPQLLNKSLFPCYTTSTLPIAHYEP